MTSRIVITPQGKQALVNADESMSSLEVRSLVMVVDGPRTFLEIVAAVRSTGDEYKFLDPKFVSKAVSELADRTFIRYESDEPVNKEERRAKRGRGRQRR